MSLSDAAAAVPEGVRDEMRRAVQNFLDALSEDQLKEAQHPFSSPARTDMSYFPGDRVGLPLKEMTPTQQESARALVRSALSQSGSLKAASIMNLERVLRDMGGASYRDPDLYFFAVFGEPGPAPWGWRAEGHHLSINLTFSGETMADTPSFFGANPAIVREDGEIVARPLAAEEELARALVESLDQQQQRVAIISAKAPREIITGSDRRISREEPAGLSHAQMNPAQRDLLADLIREYLRRHRAELTENDWKEIEQAGLGQVHFAWAGSTEPGQGHYYRIQGPTFLMEYDNTQDDANHIHTVWRSFDGDYGFDVLADHYQNTPHD